MDTGVWDDTEVLEMGSDDSGTLCVYLTLLSCTLTNG